MHLEWVFVWLPQLRALIVLSGVTNCEEICEKVLIQMFIQTTKFNFWSKIGGAEVFLTHVRQKGLKNSVFFALAFDTRETILLSYTWGCTSQNATFKCVYWVSVEITQFGINSKLCKKLEHSRTFEMAINLFQKGHLCNKSI